MQELNSIRQGKYWDVAIRGWLNPDLVRKARKKEIAVREEARGV